MLNMNDAGDTFKIKVLVQFAQKDGSVKQGDFTAELRRLPQAKVDEMVDENWTNGEVLDEVLVGCEGIGRSPSEQLPSDEAIAWVKKTPECVNATVVAFFKAMRAERYVETTSKKRRSRG